MRMPVLDRISTLAEEGVPFVHATVVRAQHPTSVHAGDGAIVHADGRIEGFLGGICTEEAVRDHAGAVLRSGDPLLLRVLPDAGDPEEEPGAVTVHNPCVSGGAIEIFLRPHLPRPRMVAVGATPVAKALAELGDHLGYHVDLVPPGESLHLDEQTAAVVVASHGRGETEALQEALRATVPYVGLVASRRRSAEVLSMLDVEPILRERVHTPAGLPIGARTAPEIALSILAEVVSLKDESDTAGAAEVFAASAPETATDPICGMSVTVSADAIRLDTADGPVYFCGEGCRRAYGERHSADAG